MLCHVDDNFDISKFVLVWSIKFVCQISLEKGVSDEQNRGIVRLCHQTMTMFPPSWQGTVKIAEKETTNEENQMLIFLQPFHNTNTRVNKQRKSH